MAALSRQAKHLKRRGRTQEAVALLREVADALYIKSICLGGTGHHDAQLETLDELIRRFGQSTSPGISRYLALAMYNKGFVLRDTGRRHEAAVVWDETVERFWANPPERDQVLAKLALWAGDALTRGAAFNEALDVYSSLERELRRSWMNACRPLLSARESTPALRWPAMSEYVVIYEEAEDGGWGAYLPDLPGVVALGPSREDVAERIQEAIIAYAEDLRERGEALPPPHHAAGIVAA